MKLQETSAESSREIAEHKRAVEQFRLVVEAAPNGLLMTDEKGIVVLANSQIEKLFGYAKQELLGQSLEILVPERFRGRHHAHRERFSAAPQARPVHGRPELFGLRKDGSEFPVEIGLNPIKMASGTHVLASIMDITERKAADERMRQSEERFRSMIENVKDHAIFMLDGEGRVLTWNKGAERLTGHGPEEIIGEHYSCFYPTEDRESGKPEQILQAVLADGQWEDEGWRLRKDGSKFWANVVITAVRDEAGSLLGFSAVTRDLTRRRQIEEKLRTAKEEADAANQAKSAFLANVSHEIRTPMAGMIGMAGLLFDTELSPAQREYCEIIRRSSESLLTVINDLLDFSKVESGKLELEIIDFDLRSAVEEVMDLFAKQAEDKGVDLINFIRHDVPTRLQGDPGRLRQVLSNLVNNALKFTSEGEVVVRVAIQEQTSSYVVLRFSVTDTGIGIPQEKQGKLFNAFTQVDASTTRRYGGTGLGLAICKKFIELMQGEISVKSEPASGSTFWFTAQFLKQRGNARNPSSPSTNLHGVRALVVEGNSTTRVVLDHYLSALQIVNDNAVDAPAALEMLRVAAENRKPYDLAILDFRLSGVDGVELARAIRKDPKFGTPKLLLLTSLGKRGDAKLAQAVGINAYLTKPLSFSCLSECLTVLMGEQSKTDSSALVTRHTLASLKGQQRLRILVADDNYINQKVTAALLENMGERADVVGNGKEALEAFKLIPYDIVLLDLQMPEMDGFEASIQMRLHEYKTGRHSVIIAVTAHAMKEDREKCLGAGMDDYISKPINPRQLKTVIGLWTKKVESAAAPDDAVQGKSSAAVWNFPEALAKVEGDRELLREITRLFLEQYPALLEQTRQALSRSDCQLLTRAAHILASSAGQVGAQRVFAAARKLEDMSRGGDFSHVPDVLSEMGRELLLVKLAVSSAADFTPVAPAEAR
jgi:PAS domain S-box-containing protein